MKIRNIFAGVSLALGLASVVQAQTPTTVYIAGAPALRTELTTAIENLLVGQGSVVRTYNGTNLIGASVVKWTGGTIAGNPVTIKLTYNGSAAGWKTNAASQTVRFSGTSVGQNAPNVLTNLTAEADVHVPDFHISNEFQASTPWFGTNSVSFPENGPTTYQQLNDPFFGILPLVLVASKGAPEGLNITPQLVYQLYSYGELRLSQLTGNLADYNKKVYPLARGIDSGIRTLWSTNNGLGASSLTLTYEAKNITNTTNKPVVGVTVVAPGVGYTSAPTVTLGAPNNLNPGFVQATATAQVANGKITGFTITNPGSGYDTAPSVSLSGGGGSLASARAVISGGVVGSQTLWPATGPTAGPGGTDNRLLGVSTPEGNSGYAEFPPLLTALTSTLNLPGGNAGDIYFTVLAVGDAQAAIAGGAKIVKWNGNNLGAVGSYGNINGQENNPNPNGGTATPSLANGQYELWGYVRLPYRNNIGAVQLQTLNAIGNQISNFEGPTLLGDVNVQRSFDGGPVEPGQFNP